MRREPIAAGKQVSLFEQLGGHRDQDRVGPRRGDRYPPSGLDEAVGLGWDLAKAEPVTLRYRLLHVGTRIVCGGRRWHLKILTTLSWADQLAAAFTRAVEPAPLKTTPGVSCHTQPEESALEPARAVVTTSTELPVKDRDKVYHHVEDHV